VFQERLELTAWDVAGVALAFLVLDLIFSGLVYRLHLRDQSR